MIRACAIEYVALIAAREAGSSTSVESSRVEGRAPRRPRGARESGAPRRLISTVTVSEAKKPRVNTNAGNEALLSETLDSNPLSRATQSNCFGNAILYCIS